MLQPQRNITEERSNWPHLPGLNMLGNCTTRPQKNKPAAKYELWSRNAWRWTFIKIGMREAVWISSHLTVQRVFDFQRENMPRNFSHSKCNVWFDNRILLSTSKWAIFESTFHILSWSFMRMVRKCVEFNLESGWIRPPKPFEISPKWLWNQIDLPAHQSASAGHPWGIEITSDMLNNPPVPWLIMDDYHVSKVYEIWFGHWFL